MEKNIEITESGLQCDNTQCDWTDESVMFDDYKQWLNKPCPKCGQNVLTEEDYTNAEILRNTINAINALSPEDLAIIQSSININTLKENKLFKDVNIDELETANPNDSVSMTMSTHKNIKIESIKVIKEDSQEDGN